MRGSKVHHYGSYKDSAAVLILFGLTIKSQYMHTKDLSNNRYSLLEIDSANAFQKNIYYCSCLKINFSNAFYLYLLLFIFYSNYHCFNLYNLLLG